MTRTVRALAAILALPVLAACSADAGDGGQTPATQDVSSSSPAAEAWTPVDRARDLGEWSDSITSASEVEPGRIAVVTTLVDGVDDVDVARQICEAAAGLEGVTYVSVAESDGTAWVLFGHPAYAEGVCSVV